MKKLLSVLLVIVLFISSVAFADESIYAEYSVAELRDAIWGMQGELQSYYGASANPKLVQEIFDAFSKEMQEAGYGIVPLPRKEDDENTISFYFEDNPLLQSCMVIDHGVRLKTYSALPYDYVCAACAVLMYTISKMEGTSAFPNVAFASTILRVSAERSIRNPQEDGSVCRNVAGYFLQLFLSDTEGEFEFCIA